MTKRTFSSILVALTLFLILSLVLWATSVTADDPPPMAGEVKGGSARQPLAAPPSFVATSSAVDFVVTGSEDATPGDEHYFPSNGDGTFGLRSDIPGLLSVDGMDVADLDGDGDNDFLVCDGSTAEVYSYTNDGAGVFTTSVVATGVTSAFCTNLRVGDFNEDGLRDFVVGDNRITNGMFVYLQAAPGTFTKVVPGLDVASWSTVGGNSLFGVAAGEVDGDGHQDILALGYNGIGAGQIRFYKGDGTGAMASSTELFNIGTDFGVTGTVGLGLFDLEGDGDLDIIAGGGSDGTHYIYTNDGFGNFTEPLGSVFDVDAQTGIDAFDADGDGDHDLVVATFHMSPSLYYVENLGGVLATPVVVALLDGRSVGVGAPELMGPEDRKVFFIQGIDSSSGRCGETFRDRVRWMVDGLIQNPRVRSAVPSLDSPDDFFYFSYSTAYCLDESGANLQKPHYFPVDTCEGVIDAAIQLQARVEQLLAEHPSLKLDFIAHSMGGMVASAWLRIHPEMRSLVHSVVTFDSPLRGVPVLNPTSDCDSLPPAIDGDPVDQSWEDLNCEDYTQIPQQCTSFIVPAIATVGNNIPFFTMDATQIDFLIEAVPRDRTTLLRSNSQLHCRFDDDHSSIWARSETDGEPVECWFDFTYPDNVVDPDPRPPDFVINPPPVNIKSRFVAIAVTRPTLGASATERSLMGR